jgi:hypothetical protein
MGMYASLVQISPSFLQEIKADPSLAQDAWDEPVSLELDKAWHGLHFLLTGKAEKHDSPLSKAVMGGKRLEEVELPENFDELSAEEQASILEEVESDEVLIGYNYYLTPEEVKEVANALSNISESDLKARFKELSPSFEEARIYPGIAANDEDLRFLLQSFEPLVSFYKDAATKGNAVLYELG